MKLNHLVKDPSKLETHGKFISPDERWERIIRGDKDPRLVKAIATRPETAFMYAERNGIFPEGEPAILKDPYFTFFYAKDIIKGRFPEGEKILARTPYWAHRYACEVINGRFPRGEPILLTDPQWACYYAIEALGSRFYEAEPLIAKDRLYAVQYNNRFGTHL